MAMSLLTLRSDNSDMTETNMATPALGPSLGMAPAGTCTCRSFSASQPRSMGSRSNRPLARLMAACALSFITSPSCPVRIS